MAFQFYEDYFKYIGDTESPIIYHRWCAISMVAALLGRSVSWPFGHGAIYPNMYILLVGNPGARKGTALKPASNALRYIDYNKLAPQRVSPERFIIEMQRLNTIDTVDTDSLLDIPVENVTNGQAHEIYVVSEEFGDFIRGNSDFINTLTNMWDNLPKYEHPKIHGKSILVHEPTVNIIGATTQQGISLNIPIEIVGQGGLSRFILVHGESTGKKITFPSPPTQANVDTILAHLQRIKNIKGTVVMTDDAMAILDAVYKTYPGLQDHRFQYYNNRRFTHLVKLAIVFAAMDGTTQVEAIHMLQANTLLYATEHRMPKALGQFGKAKYADVENTIVEMLRNAALPVGPRELWKRVSHDFNRYEDMTEVIKKLETTERIMLYKAGGKTGYVSRSEKPQEWSKEFLIQDEFLTLEERV